MRIYTLTSIGIKMARSTNNPNTNAWRVIHYLDREGQATDERISAFLGIGGGETSAILRTLRRNKIVTII